MRRLFRLGVGEPGPGEAVDWEIEHYLEERTERLIEAGWDPEDARREAERRFGRERYAARMRRMERRRARMRTTAAAWDFVRQGVERTVRGARRRPGFALGVVGTLALGIGANAAMFGIIDRLLLRPPAHVQDHEGIRRVVMSTDEWESQTLTYPDVMDLRAHGGFESVAAVGHPRELTSGHGPEARRLHAAMVSHEFFDLLRVEPALGRTFGPDEDRPGAPPTVVLGHEYWERAFGGDPDVLGTTLDVDGHGHTVVGVAPRGFTGVGLERVDAWLPVETTRTLQSGGTRWLEGPVARGTWWINAVVRLADGVSDEAAEEEATARSRNAREGQIGGLPPGLRIRLWPLIAARGPGASGESKVAAWLGGVSLIVLLIACANVASLLLARGARTRREAAVRLALGVSRARLVGHAMLEPVLLALAGGAAALVLARWGGEVVRRTLLPGVHFPDHAMDGRVVAFTLVASLLAGFLAGVGPALQGARFDLAADLGEGRRGSSLRRSKARTALIVVQATLTVVLLTGAGLFVRSLDRVLDVDLGVDADRVVLASLEFTDGTALGAGIGEGLTAERQNVLYRQALERVRRLPGVASASAVNTPFQWAFATRLKVPGVDSIPDLPGGGPYYYAVTPDYFESLGLEIVRGRPINDTDREGGLPVTVVSSTMARSLWPEGDPLGRCLLVGEGAETCTSVVGVAEDASRGSLETEPYMAYYLPVSQTDRRLNGLYARASGDVDEVEARIAALLRALSPEVRYATVGTVRDLLDPQARSWRLGASMFTVFGLLALLVAAVGLYSVLAFEVAQRTRETGIRSALGAGRGRILRGVVSEGVRLVGLGLALGLAGAWLVAPRVEALLFEVPSRDPLVMGLVTAVMGITAVAASLVPALRAVRVDPAEALRSD